MPYNYITAGEVIDSILFDIGEGFHQSDEIFLYLKEGLQFINSLSFFEKKKITFDIPIGTTFYDLLSEVEFTNVNGFEKLISEIETELDFHLLEESNSIATIDNLVFDSSKYRQLIEDKTIEFLIQTGIIKTIDVHNLTIPPVEEYEFPLSLVEIEKLYFIDTDLKVYELEEDTENLIASFDSNYITRNPIPKFYSRISRNRNLYTFYPSIDNQGILKTIAIKTADFAGVLTLPIPTNLYWVIKYGVLFELFSKDGNGFDAQRADYCDKRWKQGVELAKLYFSIITTRINGKIIPSSTLNDIDRFAYNWKNETTKRPYTYAPISWNLIAFCKKTSEIVSVELDVLANTILPITIDDFIQIPEEQYQSLYDYILHLCFLKLGGSKFASTIPKLDKAIEGITLQNSQLGAKLPKLIERQVIRYEKSSEVSDKVPASRN